MESVIIKGTKDSLVFYFNTNSVSFEELCKNLQKKLTQSAKFFLNSKYTIAPENQFSQDEITILKKILEENGLSLAPPKPKYRYIALDEEGGALYPSTSPKGVEPVSYSASEGNSILLTGTLRSGQTVEIDGNAVIMGDVNAGAHLLATGHIVIMGELRGLAHAGCNGDQEAKIIAWRMKTGQIRIADRIGREDESRDMDVPEMAQIEGDYLLVKPYEATPKPKQLMS